jgi:hypothetical protein
VVKGFDFHHNIYPHFREKAYGSKAPKTVFVPCKRLLRKMIKYVILYGNKKDFPTNLLKFGLIEDPNSLLKD